MKIFKLLFAFTIFVTCTVSSLTANAANWQEVINSKDMRIELNTDNITRVNGVYTAWIRYFYPEDKQEVYDGKKIAVIMEKFNARTTENGDEFKSIEFFEYTSEGDYIRKLEGNNTWESVIPGSFGEAIYSKIKEIRKDADAADDKKAKSKKRQQETKEAVKQAANIAGGILGGLF